MMYPLETSLSYEQALYVVDLTNGDITSAIASDAVYRTLDDIIRPRYHATQ